MQLLGVSRGWGGGGPGVSRSRTMQQGPPGSRATEQGPPREQDHGVGLSQTQAPPWWG